jgi:predicted nucleotidyltransferase
VSVKRLQTSKARIQTAARSLEVSVPNIVAAHDVAIESFKNAQTAAQAELTRLFGERSRHRNLRRQAVDIVVMGSLARGEMSPSESDLDYILIAYESVQPFQIYAAKLAAAEAERRVHPKPRGQYTGFGGLSSFSQMVNLIGLEADTNTNHTHRILLLQESMSLLRNRHYDMLLDAVLERYLYDYSTWKRGVPRFLLNDVVKYWRTIGVDYQAKRWEEVEGEKWGMRYLKLRSTRKLGFVGTVVSLLLPAITGDEASPEFLKSQFALTSLARLLQLADYIEDPATRVELANVVRLADWFLHQYSLEAFRKDVNLVQYPDDTEQPKFKAAREETQVLQRSLEKLFLSDAPLRGAVDDPDGKPVSLAYLTKRYLLF